jgi:hypothetical protein
MDFELVPVFADAGLLNYVPGIAVRLEPTWDPPNLKAFVYALYARGAGDWYIPIPGLAAYLELRDNTNTLISTSFTEVAPGIYEDSSLSLSIWQSLYNQSRAGAPPGAFDYTTAVAQFNV